MSADSGPGTREIARRLFAAEFDDASLSYSESDEERAPNYVVTPTGARVNRLFAVGVLTEVEQVNEDSVRGRIADPTGAFVTYAGQYQPDEKAFLDRTEPPAFVSLSGKARTFEPEDSDRVFTSVRPESLNEVDAGTRDRWVVSAARRTLHRIAVFAEALESDLHGDDLREALEAEGVDASLAAGIPKAIDHYGTGTAYLEAVRSLAIEAVEQVAGERDSVGTLETLPDDETPTELGALPDVDVSLDGYDPSETVEPEAGKEAEAEAEAESEAGEEAVSESAAAGSTEASTEPESTESREPEPEPGSEESASEAEPELETEPEAETEPEVEADPEEPPTAAEPAVEETGSVPAESESEPAETEAEEPPSEPEPESTDGEELGDFDEESVQETVEQESEELGDFDPSETVDEESEALSEEERKEVEEEFGAEFSTGSEVGEPGEAGIDVPTSEEELEELEEEVTGEAAETEESAEDEREAEEAAEPAEAAEDVDLEEAVVETMSDLDEGDGVAQDDVVAAVVDEYGVDAGAVEDAIQDAMMSGKCYEPEDGTLKAI